MAFAIKAEVNDPRRRTFSFRAAKTMYGGKHIAAGDALFIFASENEGGSGIIARGVFVSAKKVARKAAPASQTPQVSIVVQRDGFAKRRFGRPELKPFDDWGDGRPETELNFKFHRQATNKIVSLSDGMAVFLRKFF